jgi:fibronectin-binding autotransporter adhesin
MKTLVCRAVFVCLAVLLIAGASFGQVQDNGAGSGNWSNAANWSLGLVPNNGNAGNNYNVSLLSSPAVNITLDISPTIDTLTLDSGSVLSTDSGTTLTTTGVTNGGDIELYNGNTLTVNGSMTTSNYLDLDKGSKLVVTGSLTNSGQLYTNVQNDVTATNTITVDGMFTNNVGATTVIGEFNDTADVMNVATLANSGNLTIDPGATLNLTSQPNGITDVVQGSLIQDFGTMKAGTANAFAKLGSIEGVLVLGSGQTFTDTPGSGTLTISSTGELDFEKATNLTISGNLTNSGQLYTNVQNDQGGANTLTVTGTFTNNAGATTVIGEFNDTADVMNVPTLVNAGDLTIDSGATLNLTSQPNGITDVVAGSNLVVNGTLKAGTANGLANLGSVEGSLTVGNGQTFTDTPGTGTLTISSTGRLDLESSTKTTVSGNLANSGSLFTNAGADGGANTLTVTGTFTNNSGANTTLGVFTNSADVMNVATLVNNGSLTIGTSATLNLTSQPNGITDIVAGSSLAVNGTLKAGTANGLANLGSVEGSLTVANGQTFTDTPGSGTLIISSTGHLDLDSSTKMTVSGNLTNSSGLFTNAGADGGANTLTVTGTFTNNSGANTTLGVFSNSADVMNVATLVNNGSLTIGTSATLNLTNAGTANNTGTINVGSNAGGGAFKISGNTTLTGTTGKVILSDFAGNIIGGTGTLTNVKNTIEGSGNIGNGTMGLNNQGTIDANQSVPLIIQASGTVSNSLTMEASAGSILQLDAGSYSQTSAGNILATGTNASVDLESGVSITGGKLTTTGTTATIDLVGANATLTLSGVSVSGSGKLILPDSSTTTLMGTISNTGTIEVNGATTPTKLVVGGTSVTLSGTGKIILTDNANNQLTGAVSTDTLHNGNTIEGAGNIGEGNMGLINTGTIETLVHQANTLEIDASSTGFSNQGTLLAATGTALYIDNASNQFLNFSGTTLTGGTYVVDGTLEFDGANIVTNAANITLSGSASKLVNQSNANGLANFATNNGTFALAAGRNFTTIGNFTNNGTLNIGAGTKFAVGTNGASDLTNFSGTTLTGGTYIVAGTLQFNGANIVTNDASITLSGTAAKIEDQSSNNALANFATNGSGSTFALASGAKFNTSGNFTNNGTLNVATGTKFSVGTNGASNLTNYASDTLTGGSYIAAGTGQIQFNNESTTQGIVTNAANITLSGSTSTFSFIDQNGANMLANFATNSSAGSFTLITSRSFKTGGAFSNAGVVEISKSTTFTLGSGNYTQTGGSTTVDGSLALGTGTLNISGGDLFGNGGTITGAVDLTGGVVDPGDGLNAIGDFKISGNYTQSGGSLTIDLNGSTPNTKYDVLNITGTAALGGTLNVDSLAGFNPTVGEKFNILNYGSKTGIFSTVDCTFSNGDGCTIAYNATGAVITVTAPAAANPGARGAVSGSPAIRVSRSAGVLASTSNTHEPVAILSRVTCFASRLVGSGSCDKASASTSAHGGETALHATSSASSTISATPHNNIMVATRSISAARGGSSHETSASATAMARLYVCAYLPSTVGHAMGCK